MAYVDKAKLMQRIETEAFRWGEEYDLSQIMGDIEDFPESDVVEVVRCKDCKHSREQDKVWGITDYKCLKHNVSCLSPYDFCSYGERRDT